MDPEYGYIRQARKKEPEYLTGMTVDTKDGIITLYFKFPYISALIFIFFLKLFYLASLLPKQHNSEKGSR